MIHIKSRRSIGAVLLVLAGALAATPAWAAGSDGTGDSSSFWSRDYLTGDWGGARTALQNHGIGLSLNYIGETFGDVSGGLRRGASYEGRVEFSVDGDLDKLLGWTGGKAHFTIYNIHDGSTGNAAGHAGSIADPSNIDALSTTRLFTAWLQQSFWHDRFSLRVGQLAADDEFITSDTAGGLINGTFGWAGLLAADMTSGGPAYPLATPGARLKFQANDQISFLAGVFNGNPAGSGCSGNSQECNRHGTKFPLNSGTLWIGEMHYGVNQSDKSPGLPGMYKLGAWYANNDFADERYGLNSAGTAVSLSDPSLARSLNHRGNWGFYGVADQMVWRGEHSSLNVFLRTGFSPSDRNLVSYYVDGGLGLKGPFASRPDDTLTLGVAYAKISPDAVRADRDALALNGPPYAVRSKEMVFELNYTAQITPWWTVQPDLQYILDPNGGQNSNDPTRSLGHAFLIGLRTTIAF